MTTLDGTIVYPECEPLLSDSHRSLEQVAFLGIGSEDWEDWWQRWGSGNGSPGRKEDSYVSVAEEGKELPPAPGSGASTGLSCLRASQGREPPLFSGSAGFVFPLLWLQIPPQALLSETLSLLPGHWKQSEESKWLGPSPDLEEVWEGKNDFLLHYEVPSLELDSPQILNFMDVGLMNRDREDWSSKCPWVSRPAGCFVFVFPFMQHDDYEKVLNYINK